MHIMLNISLLRGLSAIRRIVLASVITLCLPPAVAACAQNAPATSLPVDAMRSQLQTPVRLQISATTLQAVAQSLTEQTGIKIEAASFLADRRLSIHIDNMSVEGVLNTLAEMYDWRWFAPEPGRILLTRKRPAAPENITNLPVALQSVLPVDFRTYTGIGVSLDKLPSYAKPEQQQMAVKLRKLGTGSTRERQMRVSGRTNSFVQQQIRALYNVMKSDLEAGKHSAMTD